MTEIELSNTGSYYSYSDCYLSKQNANSNLKKGILGFTHDLTGIDLEKYHVYWNAETMINDLKNDVIAGCYSNINFYNYVHYTLNYSEIINYGEFNKINLSFCTASTNVLMHRILNKCINFMSNGIFDEIINSFDTQIVFTYSWNRFFIDNITGITIGIVVTVILLIAIIGIIISLIIKTRKQNKTLIHFNRHDYLTNAYSKVVYDTDVAELINYDIHFALFMIDIDNFKGVNDLFGHTSGDILIKTIAQRLISIETRGVKVYRFAGDEFVIIYKDCSIDQAKILADRISHICDKKFTISNDSKIGVTFSSGIAFYPRDGKDSKTILSCADSAMYYVKTRNKNGYEIFDPSKDYSDKFASAVGNELSVAIEQKLVYMVYQPQYDLRTGQIKSFEALMRIKDFKYGPDKFIPVAERSGLIIKLGQIALHQPIELLSKMKSKGYDDIKISVNFSAGQIADTKYIDYLKNEIEKYGVQGTQLEIEFTESLLFHEDNEIKTIVDNFRRQGISLALDDFGSGYSSINSLSKFEFNIIKFDKQIIDTMFVTKSVVPSLINLVHGYGYKVIAEGVETKEQLEYLKKKGCDFIQGFYISKPLEKEKVFELLSKEKNKKQD